MEEKKTIMKHSMTYGAVLGVFMVLVSLIFYIMDINPQQSTVGMLATYGAIIGMMIYGIVSYKKLGGGYITFGEAFKTGLSVVFFGSLIQAFYIYIFAGFIEPEFITKMLEEAEAEMLRSNPEMTDAQLDQAMMYTEKFMSPGMMAFWTILGQAILGAVLSLVASAFLKKDNPNFQ